MIKVINKYEKLEKWVIGGPKTIDQLFDLIDTFFITRIYGNFKCDKKLDLQKIQQNMRLDKKIEGDKSCYFEIWKK